MNKDREVFMQILDLLDTVTEGLEYTSGLIAVGNIDEALEMTYNILAGVESVINAFQPYSQQLNNTNLKVIEASMYEKLNKFIEIIKLMDLSLLGSYMKNDVLSAFTDWKTEIQRLLTPYTLS